MISAANPWAVEAGLEILRQGGNAVDAAVAVSLVLGLVEPQSSGIGGGGFLLHYERGSREVSAYDGRELAPQAETGGAFLDAKGQALSFLEAQTSGRSIGVPGLVAMLELAHRDHGHLSWAQLFEPAISLAEKGFPISERLHKLLLSAREPWGHLAADPQARELFLDPRGEPRPVGYLLKNPAYARSLRILAEQGAAGLADPRIAEAILAAAHREPRAGRISWEDLRSSPARRLAPVCANFLNYKLCSVGAPASGAATLELLGIYDVLRPSSAAPQSAAAWAAFLWASRLAYADRDHYIADPALVPVPERALLSPSYWAKRAGQAGYPQAPERVEPGAPDGETLQQHWGRDKSWDRPGTSHFSVVDGEGNAVALTQTVEALFGSQRMAAGFFLNNELTDFSWQAQLDGRPVANALAPGKKPRSSMSPTIVLNQNGELELVAGSPGGASIVDYVARALMEILDWHKTPLQAAAEANLVARGWQVRLESQLYPEAIRAQLEAWGWNFLESKSEVSGLHLIQRTEQGLVGAADPRREGQARALDEPPLKLRESFRRLLLVRAQDFDSKQGSLRLYQSQGETWHQDGAEIPVVLGQAGLAWGLGLHGRDQFRTAGEPVKVEGDKRAPVGAFLLGAAFGRAPALAFAAQVPYQNSNNWECVDDPSSPSYGQLVFKANGVGDWRSSEQLDRLYELLLVLKHNPEPRVRGAGSCVFLHTWQTPKTSTSGCTAMSRGDLERLIAFVVPEQTVLVQLPEVAYARLKNNWQLP